MSTTRKPHDDTITLKYGAGGRAMRSLIEELFVAGAWQQELDDIDEREETVGLSAMDDGAAIRLGDRWLVMTTDSHVVKPLVFPGGDIGRLAVAGTVNDLAMMGATEPLGLTCGVIIEEGFSRAMLEHVQESIRSCCAEAGAPIVTGDTKVMGRGELDGLVINTAGVGLTDRIVRDCGLRVGDKLLVTGTIGDHGLTVLATRHALGLDSDLRSDVAPINALVRHALMVGGTAVVAMKDPTRGGLASALHEMAAKSGVGILLDERAVPVTQAARAAGELLGIDPLHVANEGKAVIGVAPERADAVLAAMRDHPRGRHAAIVGTCLADHVGAVILDTGFGRRLLTELDGDPLPRIC